MQMTDFTEKKVRRTNKTGESEQNLVLRSLVTLAVDCIVTRILTFRLKFCFLKSVLKI